MCLWLNRRTTIWWLRKTKWWQRSYDAINAHNYTSRNLYIDFPYCGWEWLIHYDGVSYKTFYSGRILAFTIIITLVNGKMHTTCAHQRLIVPSTFDVYWHQHSRELSTSKTNIWCVWQTLFHRPPQMATNTICSPNLSIVIRNMTEFICLHATLVIVVFD